MSASASQLSRIVRRMRGQKVGVVGDLMLDRYLWGTATRLSPEAAVPVVDFAEESECLGGAGNVAANLAELGAQVSCFGVIGDDQAGGAVIQCFRGMGLDEKHALVDRSRVTTVKTRIIARHQQVVRVDRERRAPLQKKIEETLVRQVLKALDTLEALVVSDYDKGVVTDSLAERVLTACHQRGVPALVKPKTSRLFSYRGAAVIVCNAKEAGFFVTRTLSDEGSIEEAGRAMLAHFGCAAVVITLGEKGLSVIEESSPGQFHVPATSFEITYARLGLPGVDRGATGRQVFDVTGAGDTVLSTLALAAAAGAPLAHAALLANVAAGVVVGKLGTATVSPKELLAAIRDLAAP
ncbi:MAG TPA: PfkB family carbohydrate kinase [Candidatus Dormibacteraeota bacterium]|nr:PfkB family carbohydrate kinase [Candidatus Dormibacteraeota bacterium]